MADWVACGKLMPQVNSTVLTYRVCRYGGSPRMEILIYLGPYGNGEEHWKCASASGGYVTNEVTHWMLMPPAPGLSPPTGDSRNG